MGRSLPSARDVEVWSASEACSRLGELMGEGGVDDGWVSLVRSVAVARMQSDAAPPRERVRWARVAIRAAGMVSGGDFPLLRRAVEEANARAYIILNVEDGAANDFTPDHAVSSALAQLPMPWVRVFLLALDTGVGQPQHPFLRGVAGAACRSDALLLRHHRNLLAALEGVVPRVSDPVLRRVGERWITLLPVLP